jgi:hypothetical protein
MLLLGFLNFCVAHFLLELIVLFAYRHARFSGRYLIGTFYVRTHYKGKRNFSQA